VTSRTDILLWVKRINGMAKSASPHQLLDVPAGASTEVVQEAFHRIAKMAHPDLHRNNLRPDEIEALTTAYAAIANAYQAIRSTPGRAPIRDHVAAPVAATPSGAAPVANAANAMSSRAVLYYRKAELALKRGDLRGALLQLKMAVGSDPKSAFLRAALAEVENELRKEA